MQPALAAYLRLVARTFTYRGINVFGDPVSLGKGEIRRIVGVQMGAESA